MSMWQLTVGLVVVGLLVVISLAGWLSMRSARLKKQTLKSQQPVLTQSPPAKSSLELAAVDAKVVVKPPTEWVAGEQQANAKRTASEQASLDHTAQEQAMLEQAIAEWAAAEQAEAERIQSRRINEERWDAEQLQGRIQNVEKAIAEWLEVERDGGHIVPPSDTDRFAKKTLTRTEAIHQQVKVMAEKVLKEIGDLDFIKNRIEAGVDFLPLEFKQTIDEWKQGLVLRHNTFDDLKLKFRYKAYSIEDGYELLYLYNDWLSKQRQKLRVFIRLLGTEVDKTESIQAGIERAERLEHAKYLEMNVDVIFTLRDIRAILDKLIEMETLLKQLEEVCRKRSEQIIAPPWEAKGSL